MWLYTTHEQRLLLEASAEDQPSKEERLAMKQAFLDPKDSKQRARIRCRADAMDSFLSLQGLCEEEGNGPDRCTEQGPLWRL